MYLLSTIQAALAGGSGGSDNTHDGVYCSSQSVHDAAEAIFGPNFSASADATTPVSGVAVDGLEAPDAPWAWTDTQKNQ